MIRPMHLARMVQSAGLKRDSVVLDVGCLTGYSSAILSRLCGSVVALGNDGRHGPARHRRAV
jgi:protein-L-isoaspartate(D-aspartate) O-methyltransferase